MARPLNTRPPADRGEGAGLVVVVVVGGGGGRGLGPAAAGCFDPGLCEHGGRHGDLDELLALHQANQLLEALQRGLRVPLLPPQAVLQLHAALRTERERGGGGSSRNFLLAHWALQQHQRPPSLQQTTHQPIRKRANCFYNIFPKNKRQEVNKKDMKISDICVKLKARGTNVARLRELQRSEC